MDLEEFFKQQKLIEHALQLQFYATGNVPIFAKGFSLHQSLQIYVLSV